MISKRLPPHLIFLAAFAGSGSAAAEPQHSHASTAATRAREPAHAPTPTPANSLSAYAQTLKGLHAPSTRAICRDERGHEMLVLTTINRNESEAVATFTDGGGISAIDLDRLAYLLRSAEGAAHPMDPRTLGLVYRIQRHFEVPEIRVVSGYRLPKPGSRSNHGLGRAMDIIVPGVADEDVARYAREFGFVGVGVYPTSQFVHVDIRPRSYFWVDYSSPHHRNRELGILRELAARSDAAALARGQAAIEPFAITMDVDQVIKKGSAFGVPAPAEEEDEDEVQ